MQSIVHIAWNKIDWNETLWCVFLLSVYAVWMKSVIGFHWRWEKCNCPNCGKKFKDHPKREKE